MNSSAPANAGDTHARARQIQQAIKWTVYTLLLINFGYYIYEDLTRAAHTLHAGSTFLDLTSAFATSIDESAWFLLLLMFELETYILADESWTGRMSFVVRGIRLLCFLMIAHTVYAFYNTVVDYAPTVPMQQASSLCDLVPEELSFVYNLEYVEITADNCASISAEREFFQVGVDPVVSHAEGLQLERDLAMADLVEAVVWVLVILIIELMIRLQEKGLTQGAWIRSLATLNVVGYTILLGLGVYWAWLSHWLYLWDEILWIGGFAIIDMNIKEWGEEIRDGKEQAVQAVDQQAKVN
jgi:hypothetical protein